MHFASDVRGDPRLQGAIQGVRDSLARAMVLEGVYDVLDLDSLSRGDGGPAALTAALRRSTQVVGRLQPHGDSLVVHLSIRPPGWPIAQRTVEIVGKPAPRGDPLATLGPLAVEVRAVLKRVTRPPER